MIKIDLQHKDKILSAINSAQARCKTNLLSWELLLKSIERIESYLSSFKNKELVGLSVWINCFGKQSDLPRSYRYKMYGTIFKLEYCRNGWYLVIIGRSEVGESEYFEFDFTSEQEEKILKLVKSGKWFRY